MIRLTSINELELQLNAAYRERAQLVSALSVLFESVISYSDPSNPEWPVLYLETSAGQLSWHLSRADLDLFPHVTVVPADDPRAQWDLHTTQEKYRRLMAAVNGNLDE